LAAEPLEILRCVTGSPLSKQRLAEIQIREAVALGTADGGELLR